VSDRDLGAVGQDAYSFLTGTDIAIDPNSDLLREFQRRIRRAQVQIQRINAERARSAMIR
jgi:hypothetical protein